MISFLKWLLIILVGIVVVYKALYPTYITRYRITLEVTDNGKTHSGSSVIETSATPQPRILPEVKAKVQVHGQAVVVDLGQGQKLFALLRLDPERKKQNETFVELAADVFDPNSGGWQRWIEISKMRGTKDLSPAQIPFLIRFRDLKDPMTVERVDPENLSDSFGPGVNLNRATLELVDPGIWPLNWMGLSGTPLTTGIVDVLPWLGKLEAYRRDQSNPFTSKLPKEIGYLRSTF